MSDVIKDAKQLLDGATPGPWGWSGYSLESKSSTTQYVLDFGRYGATEDVEPTPEDEELIAAAPELAQALAEETWEYAVQVSNGSKWLFLGPHPGGYRSAKGAYWFMREETAQSHRKFIEEEHFDTRIMRRRVSPVEVINE